MMRRFAIVLVSVIVALAWSIPVVNAQTQFVEAGVEKFRVPVTAPDFTLTEVNGGKISLKELRGKIILLNFFASW